MTILADYEIEHLVKQQDMIAPFAAKKHRDMGPSYGLSSFGYDIRLGDTFYRYKRRRLLSPKVGASDNDITKIKTAALTLEPGEFVLAHSVEYFRMPNDVCGIVKDKSTYARLGIAVQNTVLEPSWEGQITLEISNHNNCPVELIAGSGIAQVLFLQGNAPTQDYGRDGKYQKQKGVVLPR